MMKMHAGSRTDEDAPWLLDEDARRLSDEVGSDPGSRLMHNGATEKMSRTVNRCCSETVFVFLKSQTGPAGRGA